jgi:hypothetical protein
MKINKNKPISVVQLSFRRFGRLFKFIRLGRKTRRVIGVLAAGVLAFVAYQTFIMVHASYVRTNQSVVAPFAVHLNQAIKNVDVASLKILPATSGTWSVYRGTMLSGETLEFTPKTGFKPATHYTVSSLLGKRLLGGSVGVTDISFSTVRAPAVVKTGLVTLADESIIAPSASFTIKLAEPNEDIRNLELISTPKVPVSLTTSDNDTVYTWHPKQLLPSGADLSIEVYDARSDQMVAQKQVVVANAPQIASFNEPTNFSQGDTALITFNEPIVASTADIHFSVAGSGTWQSSTVYAFTPTTVQPGQTYQYTVAPGVHSTNGGLTSQPLTGSFSTVGHVTVTGESPTGSGLNQASQVVSFTFDQPVDHQSAATHFSISSGTVANESWDENTFSATVTSLGYGQTVTATMASGIANGGFGLPSDQAFQFTFRTALDPGVAAQLAYAEAEWDDTDNPIYGNLDSVGGDCANFVSQTLIARGWKMDGTWYNYGNGNWSAAWGYVPSLDDYLRANASNFGLEYLTAGQRSQFAVGDIVIFSWEGTPNADTDQDHVEMISQITNTDGQISVKLASHNNYGLYRDLDEQITIEHPGATFHVWHLTQDTN